MSLRDTERQTLVPIKKKNLRLVSPARKLRSSMSKSFTYRFRWRAVPMSITKFTGDIYLQRKSRLWVEVGPTRVGTRSDTYGSANEVSAQDLQVAKNLYEALQALDSTTRRVLNVPLTRWVASLDGKGLVGQAIDLGIALEALYVEDRAAEIGFRLRIRAARHLREDPEERGTVIEQLRRFYELRSVAVHRGELGAKKTRIRDKLYEHGEVIEMARALCREGIFKMIDDGGLPNWERMALA